MRLKLITAPTEEAVTVDEVKENLAITGVEQDDSINRLIKAARREYENYTGRILLLSTWDLYLDEFPDEDEDYVIELPGPLVSVTSVTYQDEDNVAQTFSATTGYDVDTMSEPARIFLRYDQCWPTTYGEPNDIVVRFIAGYASADAVPEHIKQGCHLYIAHHLENREPSVVGQSVLTINSIYACWDGERVVPV